mgnify:CR=1 FL=1
MTSGSTSAVLGGTAPPWTRTSSRSAARSLAPSSACSALHVSSSSRASSSAVAPRPGTEDGWASRRLVRAAEALGLPGSNHEWAVADPAAALPSFRSRMYSQMLWTQNMMMPYLWMHMRGKSVGTGRPPRRPELETLESLGAQA